MLLGNHFVGTTTVSEELYCLAEEFVIRWRLQVFWVCNDIRTRLYLKHVFFLLYSMGVPRICHWVFISTLGKTQRSSLSFLPSCLITPTNHHILLVTDDNNKHNNGASIVSTSLYIRNNWQRPVKLLENNAHQRWWCGPNVKWRKNTTLVSSKILKEFTFKLKCPDNLLTPMSSKIFMYFFLQSKINEGFRWKHSRICIHIVSFNGLQMVEGQNYSFSAASK